MSLKLFIDKILIIDVFKLLWSIQVAALKIFTQRSCGLRNSISIENLFTEQKLLQYRAHSLRKSSRRLTGINYIGLCENTRVPHWEFSWEFSMIIPGTPCKLICIQNLIGKKLLWPLDLYECLCATAGVDWNRYFWFGSPQIDTISVPINDRGGTQSLVQVKRS